MNLLGENFYRSHRGTDLASQFQFIIVDNIVPYASVAHKATLTRTQHASLWAILSYFFFCSFFSLSAKQNTKNNTWPTFLPLVFSSSVFVLTKWKICITNMFRRCLFFFQFSTKSMKRREAAATVATNNNQIKISLTVLLKAFRLFFGFCCCFFSNKLHLLVKCSRNVSRIYRLRCYWMPFKPFAYTSNQNKTNFQFDFDR